jgi:hypothetical protein
LAVGVRVRTNTGTVGERISAVAVGLMLGNAGWCGGGAPLVVAQTPRACEIDTTS